MENTQDLPHLRKWGKLLHRRDCKTFQKENDTKMLKTFPFYLSPQPKLTGDVSRLGLQVSFPLACHFSNENSKIHYNI